MGGHDADIQRSPQMLDPARVAPAPWRNGLGATRELAARTGPDGRLLWRISVASLNRDTPFSAFPGLDRLFVALGPVRLEIDGESHTLTHGDQVRFAGEAAVRAFVSSPTRALNVMTQRSAAQARVVLRDTGRRAMAADFTIDLGAVAADVRVDLGGRLRPFDPSTG